MTTVIVGIHGLANKPDEGILADWWEKSIREGLAKNCDLQNADFEFQMVYWADLLYKYPQHQDVALNFDSLYNGQPYTQAPPGPIKPHAQGRRRRLRSILFGFAESAFEALRHRFHLNLLDDWALGKIKVLRDLDFYYDEDRRIHGRDGQPRQARRVLMDELQIILLRMQGRRIFVIAHSMGSIIAYDVLRDIGRQDPSFAVADFVTIGSPLGLPPVKAHIHRERESYARVPVRTPTIVTERWVNYADPDDPIAIDSRLRDDYRPNDRGIRVQDIPIFNSYLTPEGNRNPHKSYGYLRTPELSAHIRAAL
ncbi:MAG: alpha/beta hydrolase [Chloroflexi bacterium]|nr:alpha/beta hydrolase [Chloroflexota bacterium]